MGIDLLDIVYRLEKRFSIRIDREDFTGPMEEWEAAAKAGGKAQQELQDKYIDRLTVRFLCDIVERKIREQNEGKTDFPDVLSEARVSVHRELARLFEATPDTVQDELTLKQLADHTMPDCPPRFWRQFYRPRSTDSPELKSIKRLIRSSQLISGWTTFVLASCLTTMLLFLLWLVLQFVVITTNIPNGLVTSILIALWVILCGCRWFINHYRRNRPPSLAVGDLVKELADQRPDRSVRADGLPYTQEEILRGVAEALCEALAVEPEDVTMDARIIKDLGAE